MSKEKDLVKRTSDVLRKALNELETGTQQSGGSERNECRESENSPSCSASDEFRRAFPGLCSRNVSRPSIPRQRPWTAPVGNPKKKKMTGYNALQFQPADTWTHDICILARRDESTTPDRKRSEALLNAGLGRLRIVFPNKNASHDELQRFLEEKFPKLKASGGFEVLRAVGGGGGQRRLIPLLPSRTGYTIPHLKENLSSAVGYLRPLQADLDESPIDITEAGSCGPSIKCIHCSVDFTLMELKEHATVCSSKPESPNKEGMTVEASGWEFSKEGPSTSVDVPRTQTQDDDLELLKEMFPKHEENKLKDVLETSITISDAVANIVGDHDVVDISNTQQEDPTTLSEALKVAANQVYGVSNLDAKKRLRMKVRRRSLWDDTITTFSSLDQLELKFPLSVRFIGEEAVDLGGPQREFFSVLFQNLEKQRTFVGDSLCLTLSHDALALEAKEYGICGTLVALSLLNGSSGPRNFAPSLANYILQVEKLPDVPVKCEVREIPYPDVRIKCQEIAETANEEDFSEKVLSLEERFDAGFNKATVSFSDKSKLLTTIAYHYVISTCHNEIEQFMDGLSFGGVLDILKKFPEEASKELTDNSDSVITPEDLEGIFEADLSSQGSNQRMLEEDILFNWQNFLSNVFKGRVSQTIIMIADDTFEESEGTKLISLNDVLMFTTGCYHLPSMGLAKNVTIQFDHEVQKAKRVTANTCGPILTFPVLQRYTCDLDTFCRNVSEDIVSSPGFGFV